MGSSWIRDQTHVSCTGRQTPNHKTTREAQRGRFHMELRLQSYSLSLIASKALEEGLAMCSQVFVKLAKGRYFNYNFLRPLFDWPLYKLPLLLYSMKVAIALPRRTSVGKVMSLLFNMLSRELVMDREAWRAAVRGVAKSRTRLSN